MFKIWNCALKTFDLTMLIEKNCILLNSVQECIEIEG